MQALTLKHDVCVWATATPQDCYIKVGSFADFLSEWRLAHDVDYLYPSRYVHVLDSHSTDLTRHDANPNYDTETNQYVLTDPHGQQIYLTI